MLGVKCLQPLIIADVRVLILMLELEAKKNPLEYCVNSKIRPQH